MSVFRVEKTKGYTVMSNHHLRNHALSIKAKGLLSQMLSLPEDWDYTLQGLAQINKESIDAIREAVRELERAGYIERSRERDERGCLRGTVYTIYEQPHTEPTPEEPTQALPALDNPTLEKPMLDAFGVPERVDAIVISCQHDATKDPAELREELRRLVIGRACHDVRVDEQTKIFINPSGRFVLGGFEADTGLTGRKLMVDTYGGLTPHGGGALSGKDGTKVDRSGAYMARYVAKNIVAAGLADACTVSLAYAIGQAEPVAVEIDTQESGYYDDAFLTEAVRRVFDFTPAGMIRALDLDKPFFAEVCNNCHFMHPQAAWEQMDKAEKLRMACAELEDERT